MEYERGERYRLVHRLFIIALITAFAIICINYASAFGLSTPYLPNDTLRLEPGQSYKYSIALQNTEDFEFSVDFNYSSDYNIATLEKVNNTLKPKTYDNNYTFDIEMPYNAIPGEEYRLTFSATPILNISGQVPMVVAIKRTLTILAVDKDGQGEKLSILQKFQIWMKRNKNLTSDAEYALLGIAILASIVFISARLWRVSNKVSERLTKQDESKWPRAVRSISSCSSLEEIIEVVSQIPQEAFEIQRFKEFLSEQFLHIDEKFLSQRVLSIDSKEELLSILKM